MIASYGAAAASLAGLVLSIYLTIAPTPQFCEITSFMSCDRVLSSPYAKVMGVPTALYGAGWFAAASTAAFLSSEKRWAARFLVAWSLLGILGIAALIYVELVLINALCILCTAAHVLGLAVAILTFFINR
ncbi:MAG: vitamin K epoxide reductase family protein [Candidatus Caldarchaeum sp.]|uniref:Vitamin K epoxide reductase family protein n=1 Tax=Caldiarchaeum subterraneum TaxID=311458 RepID=A0A7C5LC79_CALS0